MFGVNGSFQSGEAFFVVRIDVNGLVNHPAFEISFARE
jgi:hypothetical protein